MLFKDASKIHEAVERMRLANYRAASNRAKVNDLFNGNPPWSEDEKNKNKIFHNANPLYGTRIAHAARQSLDNASLKPGNFFDVRLDKGPKHKRTEWGHVITKEANRALKKDDPGQAFSDMWSGTNAQVVLHGIGPVWWSGRENPVPREIGIEDVLVPAQTLLNFSNLEFFAINRQWTYAELWDMTHGEATDPGWNMGLVESLLKSLSEQDLQSTVMGSRWMFPEKLAEDLKENAGIFMTSAAPTLFIWDFYYRCYDKDADHEQWNRRIVLDYMQMQPEAMKTAMSGDAKNQFLYEKDDYCGPLSEALHFQVGNCSNVAPFRYYSVRSLGFLLFAVCQIQNRFYNKTMDATSSNLLELFRNVGEDDRERLEKVDLWHMGIVPDGLSFVTAQERHEVNEQLIQMSMAMNRQLMQESSSTWMPEIDTGTAKEQTLGEARIRLQTSASLSQALMSQHYDRAGRLYRESCRRLCLKGTKNRVAKEFQRRCREQGVDEDVLDIEAWEVEPNRIMGGGNKALENLAADKLMAQRGAYDPDAQQEILYISTLAITDNADLSGRLVPMNEKPVSEATQLGTLAMGTLMEGLPVAQRRGVAEVEYVKTLLGLTAMVLEQATGLEQTPNSEQIRMSKLGGLSNALQHAQQHLQTIAGDVALRDTVKALNDELQQQGQELQALTQHLQQELEAKSQQAQGGEEAAKLQAKLQAMLVEAQSRAKLKEADAAQKQQHKDVAWMAEKDRKDASAAAEIQRGHAKTIAEIRNRIAQAEADIAALDLTTAAEIERPKPVSNGDK